MDRDRYETYGYYEKWACSIASLLLERGTIDPDALDRALGSVSVTREPLFKEGDSVRVLQDQRGSRWRQPHLRVPGYIFGASGVVERYVGLFEDPEFLAFRAKSFPQPLYRVKFLHSDLWDQVPANNSDTLDVEIYQSWLEPTSPKKLVSPDHLSTQKGPRGASGGDSHSLSHGNGHSHSQSDGLGHSFSQSNGHGHSHGGDGHVHIHEPRNKVEMNAVIAEGHEPVGRRVAEALVDILIQQGIIAQEELRQAVEKIDELAGPLPIGPRLVVQAWLDPAFKERLLEDAASAAAELGISASNSTASTKLVAVENTEDVHNLVVCTLCSCYPLSVLGLSPSWYKSRIYRAWAVREPRQLLKEAFGTVIRADVKLSVHDSTADCRYIVIPQRPDGTENWSEEALQSLVTRDSMIRCSCATESLSNWRCLTPV